MDTASYWAKRELQLKKRQIKNTSNYEYALESRLKDLQREINKEVKYWMTKYADNNEISQQEAERILNGIDTKHFELTLEEFERKAKQGGNDKLLNSEYYKSRVARAEQIKKQLEHLGGQFAGTESDQLRRALESQYADTYYHETWLNQQAYGDFSVDFNHFDEDQLRTVAWKPWQGSDFSERVWGEYHKELPSQLSDAILRGILLGESYAKVSKRLEDRMADVKKSSVHRLVATEMGHIAEQATYDFYKDEGLEEYEYLATLETRTCGICGGLDGKHFKVSEAKSGVNYPLIHPYCRCTTIPYRPDLPPLETRWERDPKTGKGRIVNYQTYEQWAQATNTKVLPKATAGSVPKMAFASGALNESMPNGRARMDQHAKLYYDELRNSDRDIIVDKINANTKISKATISTALTHILDSKYPLKGPNNETEVQRFYPDYDMAESLQRVIMGKPLEHDIIMLRHEALEAHYMDDLNMDYEGAHTKANKEYNYQKALLKYRER